MSGREVKNETAAMTAVPVAQEGAHRGVLVGIEIVQNHMHARLTVLACDQIHEGEEVWTLAGTGYAARYPSSSHIETGKKAARAVTPVFEL